ncbi:MAG TPA: DUF4197 family protein [Allosphingosinicella sp.]|jgi:hypothetical protein
MNALLSRRALIGAGLAVPLVGLTGCATRLGDLVGLEGAIRRILTLSSQRAFARLLTEEGFFQDDLARVQLPPQLGSSNALSAIAVALGTRAVQDRLLRLVNAAAREGAEAAAPLVYDSIRDMSITDAARIMRGGSTAATDYLASSVGERIFDVMFPQVGNALNVLENGAVRRALQVATGINFASLQSDITRKGATGIYRAIGREEAAIRANPQSTGDPAIIAALSILR